MKEDWIGKTINGFKISDYKRENKRTLLYAECPFCHQKKWIRSENIRSYYSCGCYNKEHNFFKSNDLTKRQFGRLTVIYPTDQRDPNNGSVIWHCKCQCNNEIDVSATDLTRMRVSSCGCLAEDVQSQSGHKVGQFVKDNFCKDGTNIKNLTSKIPKNNTSGYKGVSYDKKRCKWTAQIVFQSKSYYLGRYDKKEDAVEARKLAEKELFEKYLKRIPDS